MNNIAGLAIFALGIVLLIFGFNESQSSGSDLASVLVNNAADQRLWMLSGGAVAVVLGLVVAIRSRKN